MNAKTIIENLANKTPKTLAQRRQSAMFLHICLPLLLIIISSLAIVILEKRHIGSQYKTMGANDMILIGSKGLDKSTLQKVLIDYTEHSKKVAVKNIDKSKQVVALGLTLGLLTAWLGLGILYVGILTEFYLVNYIKTSECNNNVH